MSISIRPARSHILFQTTEDRIEAYKALRRSSAKCQACGEPTTRYGYCVSCKEEMQRRIDKTKKALEKSPANLYKEEYVVIDITQL